MSSARSARLSAEPAVEQRPLAARGEHVRRGLRREDALGRAGLVVLLRQRAEAARERHGIHLGDSLDRPVHVLVGPPRLLPADPLDEARAVLAHRGGVGRDRLGHAEAQLGRERRRRLLQDHRARPARLALEQADRRHRAEAVPDQHVGRLGMHLEHRRGEAGRVDLAPHRPAAVAGLVDRAHVPPARGQRRPDPPPRARDRGQPVDQQHAAGAPARWAPSAAVVSSRR